MQLFFLTLCSYQNDYRCQEKQQVLKNEEKKRKKSRKERGDQRASTTDQDKCGLQVTEPIRDQYESRTICMGISK